MNQAIRTIDINKSSEISQTGNTPHFYCAFMELIQEAVFDGFTSFLKG